MTQEYGAQYPLRIGIFDIEADNLLLDATKIHCLCVSSSNGMFVFDGRDDVAEGYIQSGIPDGIQYLKDCDVLVGHNILMYDLPMIDKFYGTEFCKKTQVIDTMLISQLIQPDRPGGHGLESWGEWLGFPKGQKPESFDVCTDEMIEYCKQDVEVTRRLFEHLRSTLAVDGIDILDWEPYKLERQVAPILQQQYVNGFYFDTEKALEVVEMLETKQKDLTKVLQNVCGYAIIKGKETVSKRTYGDKTEGVKHTPVKFVPFNPGSRQHIINFFKKKYSWDPKTLTDKGNVKIDHQVISELPYPEAQLLEQYLLIDKRLGQLHKGAKAWTKLVREDDHRIHGSFFQNGAVTGRLTHWGPNMAQVPKSTVEYGQELRSLFMASPGRVLVGCDASALEMRCMAGYMAKYDGGVFRELILDGDMHQRNADALGLDRATAKTWFYAFIYGAGDAKLGKIYLQGKGGVAEWKRQGAQSRVEFFKNVKGIETLMAMLQIANSAKGWIRGLDGRHLWIRSEHALLNTLLQSAGAVLMKQALVLADRYFKEAGLDVKFVNNVHDEWQMECEEKDAEDVGKLGVKAIQDAGKVFKFPCPLDGEYKIGKTWAETH